MKKARLRAMLQVFGIAALASAISAAPASAQSSDDCRCVDPQGNAIENCSCFRASPLRGFLQGLAPQADARPRIGISVDAQQSARMMRAAPGSPPSSKTVRQKRPEFVWAT